MADSDRARWDAKYQRGEHARGEPSALMAELACWLPISGRALDLAGGAGRHSIWMARRGLTVTLCDISTAALEIAAERANSAGVSLNTIPVDLEEEPFPVGPWDLILSFHYLWRPLFRWVPDALSVGGTLVCVQPTVINLERHAKPPRPFLVNPGELPTLAQGLEVLHYEEGWLREGRHEAVLVARRPHSGIPSPS